MVTDMLPELFEELEKFLQNSKQVCADLHLCTAITDQQSLLPTKMVCFTLTVISLCRCVYFQRGIARHRGPVRVNTFMQMINSLQTKKHGIYMSCLECKVAVEAILIEVDQPANVV